MDIANCNACSEYTIHNSSFSDVRVNTSSLLLSVHPTTVATYIDQDVITMGTVGATVAGGDVPGATDYPQDLSNELKYTMKI